MRRVDGCKSKIRDLRLLFGIKSRILKWTLIKPKFLLVLESAPKELILIPKILLTLERRIRVMMKTGEMNEMDRFPSSSSRRGSEDTNYRSYHSRTHGETSFIEGIDEHTPLIRKENELNDSVDEIKRKFPNADTSKFISEIDEYGRVKVKLNSRRRKRSFTI